MGIVDMFSAEDRVSVKFSDFYSLVKAASEKEILMNAVKMKVPHKHMYAMMTGTSLPESTSNSKE